MTSPLLSPEDMMALAEQGLLRRRRTLQGAQGARICVDGREVVSFCSNDYLGLANHPALIEAARDGAMQYGVGAGASHLITGHSVAHAQLESALAAQVGLERALLFSTGYMANLGLISGLMGRHDTVVADRLNHASLNDAVVLSRARFQRYAHGDLGQLETLLARATTGRRLVVTDAVFSMDGDIAPLPEILALCERYDALLMVDDAHGFGVLGERGRGSLEHFGLASPRLLYMATLGKAAGVSGAFVAGGDALIQTLIQRARTYIYTTASPPLLAVATLRALELMREEPWRRTRLNELVARLRANLKGLKWPLMPSATPIQPLLIGANPDAVAVSEALWAKGILVPAIRPPTVPSGTARLRISLSAAHEPDDIDFLSEALSEAARALKC